MAISAEQEKQVRDLLDQIVSEKLRTYGESEEDQTSIPFLDNLIQYPDKLAAYSFIHSMVTSLGMSFYEKVSEIVAKPNVDFVERKSHFPVVGISDSQRICISRIVNDLQAKRRKPNTRKEINEVLRAPSAKLVPQEDRTEVDFYMRKGKNEYFIEVKSPRPNKGEFRSIKERLLEWAARRKAAGRKDRITNVICGFTYNPWHPNEYKHFSGMHIMHRGGDFLIGHEYWDFLGGENTFEDLLDILQDVGNTIRPTLQVKFDKIAANRGIK